MPDSPDSRPTVLVVEDERELAQLYGHWLADDYSVQLTFDGDEALDAMTDAVDVVVLDRRMPTLSGDEVLRSLEADGYDATVVMVTAVDPDLDLTTLPIDDYIEKPVTREVFTSTIERLVRLGDAPPAVRRYQSLERRRDIIRTARTTSDLTDSEEYETLLEQLEAAAEEAGEELTWLDQHFYDAREARHGSLDRR